MERFRGRLGGEEGERPVVELPFDAKTAFGKARAPVRGRLNGTGFRTSVAVYAGHYYVGFNKQLRERAAVEIGDDVEIELELDTEPREVEPPTELERAFATDAQAREAFDGLAYSHRREYAEWVAGAKKQETRERRAAKALELLRAGTKHP